MGTTVQQQLNFCAQSGLPVTDDFIRRLNASPAADATYGLSGDAGFLNKLLIGSVENLSFSAEFELVDAAQKVQQRFTVAILWPKSRNERRFSACSSEYITLDSGNGDPSLHGCSARTVDRMGYGEDRAH
jgi:hypothetical protein